MEEEGEGRGGEQISLRQMSQSLLQGDKPIQPIQKTHQMARVSMQYCSRRRERETERESALADESHNEMWQINQRQMILC